MILGLQLKESFPVRLQITTCKKSISSGFQSNLWPKSMMKITLVQRIEKKLRTL